MVDKKTKRKVKKYGGGILKFKQPSAKKEKVLQGMAEEEKFTAYQIYKQVKKI